MDLSLVFSVLLGAAITILTTYFTLSVQARNAHKMRIREKRLERLEELNAKIYRFKWRTILFVNDPDLKVKRRAQKKEDIKDWTQMLNDINEYMFKSNYIVPQEVFTKAILFVKELTDLFSAYARWADFGGECKPGDPVEWESIQATIESIEYKFGSLRDDLRKVGDLI